MSEISDENLEVLLSRASRRATPDDAAFEAAHAAVHREWRSVTASNRRRRLTRTFAMAASIATIVFIAAFTLWPSTGGPVMVATIERSFGSIHILGDESTLRPADDLARIAAGQTVITSEESGLALSIGGGSLRVDEHSEIYFVSDTEIRLNRGSLYFDSEPAALLHRPAAGTPDALRVSTANGMVEHTGTQFMVATSADRLMVAVREGHVEVYGNYYNRTVESGKQANFVGRSRPSLLDVASHGDTWRWVTKTSPPVVVDGQPIDAFLQWAGRELGYRVEYASDELAQDARTQTLRGTIDSPPDRALTTWMSLTGYAWRISEGVIYVTEDH